MMDEQRLKEIEARWVAGVKPTNIDAGSDAVLKHAPAAVSALIAEVRRLQQQAEGQPVLKTEWQRLVDERDADRAEVAQARAEIERLRTDVTRLTAVLREQQNSAETTECFLRSDLESALRDPAHEACRQVESSLEAQLDTAACYLAETCEQRDAARAERDAARAALQAVETWLTVLEGDECDIDVLTHEEMLGQVRAAIGPTQGEGA